MSDSRIGMSMYELNQALLEKATEIGVSLEQIARNLERIAGHAEQMANDDPLSRVERALDRAGDVLGYDPATPQPQSFDNRFAGRPIEESVQ